MKEISYHKDYRHNYLILKEDEDVGDAYRKKMLMENRMQGLLPCRIRYINGEALLYYEITSKQTMQSRYEGGKVGLSLLQSLFVQLKAVTDALSEYLLPETGLMLSPEYVYMDAEREAFYFVYDPFGERENELQQLLEFLADNVNGEDHEAVQIVYRMLDLAEKEQLVLDEILEWFAVDAYGDGANACRDNSSDIARDHLAGTYYENRSRVNHTDISEAYCKERSAVHRTDRRSSDTDGRNTGERESTGTYRNFTSVRAAACYMAAAILLGGTLIYLQMTYVFSERIQIFLYAGLALCALLFLLSLARVMLLKIPEDYLPDWARQLLPSAPAAHGRKKKSAEAEQAYREADEYEQMPVQPQSYGDTVFIPWTENSENKLYGIGRENKHHIDLNRLPVTVGKMAGSVDILIDHQSISRRHAKFFREGDCIYMTDLNSTNGTFRNGLRLTPNTSELLEPGDEVRLGKLKFVYR